MFHTHMHPALTINKWEKHNLKPKMKNFKTYKDLNGALYIMQWE